MDVEGADAQRVEGELMSYDLVPESAGGDTLVARQCQGEDRAWTVLLEKVLLQADLLDLKANPDRPATGTVIEAGRWKRASASVPRRSSSEARSRSERRLHGGRGLGQVPRVAGRVRQLSGRGGPVYTRVLGWMDDWRRPSPEGRRCVVSRA